MSMDLANRIKTEAKKLKITQIMIANKVGKTKGAINQWFTGRSKPNKANLVILAKMLKVTPEYLQDGEGQEAGGENKESVPEKNNAFQRPTDEFRRRL